MERADKCNATNVAGVYSTRPGYLGDMRQPPLEADAASADGSRWVPVAMMGLVPVKATAEDGAIQSRRLADGVLRARSREVCGARDDRRRGVLPAWHGARQGTAAARIGHGDNQCAPSHRSNRRASHIRDAQLNEPNRLWSPSRKWPTSTWDARWRCLLLPMHRVRARGAYVYRDSRSWRP